LSAGKKFSQEVMALPNEPGLTGCLTHLTHTLKEISALKADPLSKIRSIQGLMVMEAITCAALARKNSLGPHYRTDDPTNHHRIYSPQRT
jgi:aspartate oxidase